MSSILPYAVGLLAGVSTYIGGRLAMALSGRRGLIFALTGGLVVGLALFDLMPEAAMAGSVRYGAPTIVALIGVGFGLYLALHRLAEGGRLGSATLLGHSIMDGIGIGLAFEWSSATGWLFAAAVLAHDMGDGANMIGLNLTAADARRAHRWLLADALAPVAGVAIGRTVPLSLDAFAPLLALFAGGFFYIGACELLPRARMTAAGWAGVLASIVGLTVMGGVVYLAR